MHQRQSLTIPHSRKIQIRAASEDPGAPVTLTHWAPPWNVLSEPVDWFWTHEGRVLIYELFERGAFSEILAGKPDVICEADHRFSAVQIFGRTGGQNTLRLEEDDYGLRFDCDIPDSEVGNSLVKAVRREDVRGSSFVFGTELSGVVYTEMDGKVVRIVRKAKALYSVGYVIFPAYVTDRPILERGAKQGELGPIAQEYLKIRGLGSRLETLKSKQAEYEKQLTAS